jgi:hypothetical protein
LSLEELQTEKVEAFKHNKQSFLPYILILCQASTERAPQVVCLPLIEKLRYPMVLHGCLSNVSNGNSLPELPMANPMMRQTTENKSAQNNQLNRMLIIKGSRRHYITSS